MAATRLSTAVDDGSKVANVKTASRQRSVNSIWQQ